MALDSSYRFWFGGLSSAERSSDRRPILVPRNPAPVLLLFTGMAVAGYWRKNRGDESEYHRRRDGCKSGSLFYSAGLSLRDCQLDKVAAFVCYVGYRELAAVHQSGVCSGSATLHVADVSDLHTLRSTGFAFSLADYTRGVVVDVFGVVRCPVCAGPLGFLVCNANC